MKHSITVEEESSWIRKAGIAVCAVLSLVLFIGFWNFTDPLWGNYLRLAAFIFFAIAIIGSVSIRNSGLSVKVEATDDHLLLFYKNHQKTVREEQFDRSSIKEIIITQEGNGWTTSLLQSSDQTMKISFDDSDNILYFFTFGGRTLYFSPSNIQKVQNFLLDEGISISTG